MCQKNGGFHCGRIELCDAPLTVMSFLGHTNLRTPFSFLRARCCMHGREDYFYLIIINVSVRNAHLERFFWVTRKINCRSFVTQSFCFLVVSLSLITVGLLCLLQCMRNPALLQRTGLVIRVLRFIQENVWLLRWMCRWWRHHGQLLGGKAAIMSVLMDFQIVPKPLTLHFYWFGFWNQAMLSVKPWNCS